LIEQLRARPDGREILDAYGVALFERWLDVESDRWSAPERAATDTGERRYHGYQ